MKFIWAKDSWTSTCKTSDKLEHFNAGFMGTITLLVLWPQWWFVWVPLAFVMAVLWEVKDALYNPDNCQSENAPWPWLLHILLGDGFSWRDMLCTWAGILVAWLLVSIGG